MATVAPLDRQGFSRCALLGPICEPRLQPSELEEPRDRKWQPTPVLLPGESQGQGSLVGCHLWGRTESDTTEAT